MLTLYYVPNATSLAAHIALEWSGAKYTTIAANFGDEILRKLNPIGTAGILTDKPDQAPMTQVPAILRYLARQFPQTHLGSDGTPENDAEFDRWLSFLCSDVHHAFHLLFNPARYGIDGNEAARDAALALCYRNYGVIETHLKDRAFVLNDRKTIVDAYLFPMIRWSFVVFPEDRRDFPHLYALHDRMRADPDVEQVLRNEGTWE